MLSRDVRAHSVFPLDLNLVGPRTGHAQTTTAPTGTPLVLLPRGAIPEDK